MSASFLMNFEAVGLFRMVAFSEMREANILAWSSLSCIWEGLIQAVERPEGSQSQQWLEEEGRAQLRACLGGRLEAQ